MRLLTKTTIYFLLAMIPLLAGSGYLLFQQFSSRLNERADQELVYEEVQWIQYLEAATANGSSFILRSPDLLIHPVQTDPMPYPELSTVSGAKARENVQIPFRQLRHVVGINGSPYLIVIRKSQEQKLALVSNITTAVLLVFACLFLATLLFNWFLSKQLWRPFQATLQKVRGLELQKMEDIRFEQTDIKEFNELNTSLNTMVQKIRNDYLNMKEFTENAAHEMQTPLAVTQSKLELLLQNSQLDEPQVLALAQATEALSRLSKLNQSLLLLAKIENYQFEVKGPINLTEVTRKYLHLFDEMIKDKNLTVTTAFEGDFMARLHPFLADSLVSNLLGNAIKYNYTNGKINIRVTGRDYCLENTSSSPAIASLHMFQRFKTAGDEPGKSTGLGLAIVKRIADTSHLPIAYQHENGLHRFCLSQKP